jgi:hypothetical protein
MAGQSVEVTDCQAEPVSCQRERHELKPRYETRTKGWGVDYVPYICTRAHIHTEASRSAGPVPRHCVRSAQCRHTFSDVI